jgi:uncharacterized protein with PIN domain
MKKEPVRYCTTCGSKMIHTQNEMDTFSPTTGKRYTEEWWKCPKYGKVRHWLWGEVDNNHNHYYSNNAPDYSFPGSDN